MRKKIWDRVWFRLRAEGEISGLAGGAARPEYRLIRELMGGEVIVLCAPRLLP